MILLPGKLPAQRGPDVGFGGRSPVDAQDRRAVAENGKQGENAGEDRGLPVVQDQHAHAVDDGDDDPRQTEILRREGQQDAEQMGDQAPERGIERDGRRGRRHALAAAEFPPEGEVVPDGAAEARVERDDGAAFPEQEPADDHRQNTFENIAEQNQNARHEAQSRHDVCHAGVSGLADLGGLFPGEFPRDELGGQKAAAEIADQDAEQSCSHDGFLLVRFKNRIRVPDAIILL